MSFDSTAAQIVFCWAILPITVSFVATAATAVRWDLDLLQVSLVRGDSVHHLLVGVEDHLGPLGSLTCHCLCHSLDQRHVLLCEEVLLKLCVTHPIDEQAEDDGVAVVDLCTAGLVAADHLHLALPGLGLEGGEEALHGLARLLPDPVEFCGPGLHGLLGHAAGDNVPEDALLIEVLDLSPEAAVEHLGHVRSEALEELGGAVPDVPEPLLVLPEQVVEVVVLLLVNGLATEGERGPLHTFCLGAHLPSWSCLCCSRRMEVFSVHLEQRHGVAGGHLGGLVGHPFPRVTARGRARQYQLRHCGDDVGGLLPRVTSFSLVVN